MDDKVKVLTKVMNMSNVDVDLLTTSATSSPTSKKAILTV